MSKVLTGWLGVETLEETRNFASLHPAKLMTREYLLEKWGRNCVYCGKSDRPLQVEHIKPKSKGGSDRVSNLTLACECCNQKKSDQSLSEFLKKKPDLAKKIEDKAKSPLQDAAAVNSTR